jgi:hypothetical protein
LWHFRTRNTARVADLSGDSCDGLEEIDRASRARGTGCGTSRGFAGDAEVGVGEVRVGETEAELESGCDVLLVETTVVNEEVPVLVVTPSNGGAVVGFLLCNGVGELAAW